MHSHVTFINYIKAFESIELWAIYKAMDQARIDSPCRNLLKYINNKEILQMKLEGDILPGKISIKDEERREDTLHRKHLSSNSKMFLNNYPRSKRVYSLKDDNLTYSALRMI